MRLPKKTGLEGFDQFWDSYPKKVAKLDALKAWSRLEMSPDLLDKILRALVVARASEQWRKDNGAYVPHASTYINGERWEDVHEVEVDRVHDGKAWHETVAGIERRGAELGMTWDTRNETFQQFRKKVVEASGAENVVPIRRGG